MSALNYLLQVNAYLLLFYLFYLVLLRNETFFKLNRFYLVITALISMFIPLLQSAWIRSFFITEQVYQVTQSAAAIIIYDTGNIPAAEQGWKTENVLWIVYLSGVMTSLLILIWKLYSVRKALLQPEEKQAFSFFKTIVVDGSLPQKETIEQHEQVHAAQWHSADVLFFELLAVLNWFNPVIYCFKKAIKNIHEFIADEDAASHEKSKADYALILLNNSFGAPQYQLANSFFNQTLLKRRILMLHKEKSRRTAILKYGLSAPLFAAMLLFSSAMAAPAEIAEELKTGIRAIADNAKSKAANPQKDISSALVSEIVRSDKEETDTAKNLGQEYIRNLQRNIRYPAADRASQNTGRVICTFEVDESGKITNIRIVKSISETIQQEMLRVMNAIPDLSPELKGKYVQPIRFILNDGIQSVKEQPESESHLTGVSYKGYTPLKEIVVVGYASNSKAHAADTAKETPVNFASIDELPQFPGGQPGWAAYLKENLKYPKEVHDKKIEGRVTVTFVVEKDGSLTDIKVLRGIGYGCDEAAIRVLKSSPKWIPGNQNGKPVRVQYVMPIVFALSPSSVNIIRNHPERKPLFVIDGVVQDEKFNPQRDLVPDQIKSIEVLKNEKATTVYGQKGADGVIIVHTKATITLDAEKDAVKRKMEIPFYPQGTAPLFILDGKEITIYQARELDADAVKSIIVNKQSLETIKKYGEKGKNGVIEIISRKKE